MYSSLRSDNRIASPIKAKIETKTSAKKINIEWIINKQKLDIAKLSRKGDKKGVISTLVHSGVYTFNLELCVPGWRRAADGFSSFYLTVPRKNQTNPNNSENEDTESDDFVGRYTICLGHNGNILTRVSSIRNDFDLGVGFPNFTDMSTLINAANAGELVCKINVEIFECESKILAPLLCFKPETYENSHTLAAKLLSKMYYDRVNADAVIFVNIKKSKQKRIKVHKCVLTAASPIFHTFFGNSNENAIVINEFNLETVVTMIKFVYLNKIELNDNDYDNEIIEEKTYESDCDCDCFEETKSAEELEKKLTKSSNINEEYIMKRLEMHCPTIIRKLFELFRIAEFYEIEELLIACCHKVHAYITIETCCFLLIYLDRYHLNESKNIKDFVLEFITENIKSVKTSNGYMYLSKNKPKLLAELIDKITKTCDLIE